MPTNSDYNKLYPTNSFYKPKKNQFAINNREYLEKKKEKELFYNAMREQGIDLKSKRDGLNPEENAMDSDEEY